MLLDRQLAAMDGPIFHDRMLVRLMAGRCTDPAARELLMAGATLDVHDRVPTGARWRPSPSIAPCAACSSDCRAFRSRIPPPDAALTPTRECDSMMFRTGFSCLLMAGSLLAAPAAPALAGPYDWAIGTWTGDIEGWTFPSSLHRVLVITAVDDGGTATGTWGTTERNGKPAEITITGSDVTVVTPAKVPSTVSLTRRGDRLQGWFVNERIHNNTPLTLTR